MMASHSYQVLIGAYLNHKAMVDHILHENRDLIILCAGWKQKFNLEDTLYAGALARDILSDSRFSTDCDSTFASMDLWDLAKEDMMGYIEKVAQRHRLKKNGLDDILEYCHTFNLTTKIPVLKDKSLVSLA
jgi:2-phosphosulfolactate phosphatase